jgi:hypothetical protein
MGLTVDEPPPPGAEESDTEPEILSIPPEPIKENGTVSEVEGKEQHITTLPEDDIMSMIEAEQPPDYVKVGLLTATK